MKCEKCDREFSEKEARKLTSKVRVHRGKIVCEDCLLGMGVQLDDAEPYWAYIRLHTDIRTPKL